jgi:hypothetical protein
MITIIKDVEAIVKLYRLICATAMIFITGCQRTKIIREKLYINEIAQQGHAQEVVDGHADTYITVWVHGTRLMPRFILHNIFHAPNGLIRASDFAPKYHLRAIADRLSDTSPALYPKEYVYLFGWPGELAFDKREKAAQDLYNQLKMIVSEFEKNHRKKPKIRIITHSHGGNVVLNMAKIKDANSFVVDELILLACPVQEATAAYITDALFKETFVLYSTLDILQIADPQGLYVHGDPRPLFSQRCFPIHDNVTQVKIKINGRALFHADFIRLRFIELLPAIIDKMRSWHDQICTTEQAYNGCITQVLSIYTKK